MNILNIEPSNATLSRPTGMASPLGVYNSRTFNEVYAASVSLPLPIRQTNMRLVWSDEFNGTSVDTSKWNQVGPFAGGAYGGAVSSTMPGWSYASANNVVSGGLLSIEASGPTGTNQTNWSGGIVSTDTTFTWTYGFFECRAKLPAAGPGFWPAIWMLAAPGGSGEIDIMEWLGQDITAVYQTLHSGGGQVGTTDSLADWTAAYHKFQVWWQSGRLRFYVDDVLQRDITSNVPTSNMYFVLNFDVGYYHNVDVDWGGGTTPATPSPAYFKIDYVRIYQ